MSPLACPLLGLIPSAVIYNTLNSSCWNLVSFLWRCIEISLWVFNTCSLKGLRNDVHLLHSLDNVSCICVCVCVWLCVCGLVFFFFLFLRGMWCTDKCSLDIASFLSFMSNLVEFIILQIQSLKPTDWWPFHLFTNMCQQVNRVT